MLRRVKSQVTSAQVLKDLFLCLISSLLLILSFPKFNLGFLAWFSFVPFFFALQGKNVQQAFRLAYFLGIFFFLGIIYWLIHVTLPGMIAVVLYLAIYFGFFGLIITRYSLLSTLYSLIFIPSTWVILEYARAKIFTGFGWALLGYSQYQNLPIIQIADITSAWGVSFLVMMVNVAIYNIILELKDNHLMPRFKKICRVSCVVCLAFILVYSYGWFRLKEAPPKEHLRIALIQANIPLVSTWYEEEFAGILQKHFRATDQAEQDKPDLIVWPETAIPIYFDAQVPTGEQNRLKELFDFAGRINIPLLSGIVTRHDSKQAIYYNSAVLISEKGRRLEYYNKIHLVPFGEYIPLRKYLSFLAKVVPIDDFAAGNEFILFTLLRRAPQKSPNFGVLICFEDIFPELAREFTKRGADFLIGITNDAWFRDTSSPYQHLQGAVFRAVENRRPLVRAANTGISCFIDQKGKIYSYLYNKEGKMTFISGYKTEELYYSKSAGYTFYTNFGNVFIIICVILLLCGIIFSRPDNKSAFVKR